MQSVGPQKYIMGLTVKEFIFKYAKMFGVLLLVFYHIYPQAISFFGSSFIVPAAALGLGIYAWNKFPFVEVPKVIIAMLLFLLWCYICEYVNNHPDGFRMMFFRSRIAWFFSAYFIIFILFNVHKSPRFEVLVGYIAAAITLQCIITFVMNQNEDIASFFYSLQLSGGDFSQETIDVIEEHRLMGYGTALFGAGMVAGYGLILLAYLISKIKLNWVQFVGMAGTFCFVFFIGLFSARTTTIGLGAAIGFLFLLYFVDSSADKKQPIRFVGLSVVMFFFGAGLATIYFPDYTDWAYEMFDNFKKTGKFSTESSDALYHLFYIPHDFKGMIFGSGNMNFWGNDMGYTRLIFFIGIPGAALYFILHYYVASFAITKDLSSTLLVLMTVLYSMIMNIKGYTDMFPFLFLIFFFFIFYKYYRYLPNLYLQRRKAMLQKKQEQQQTLKESSNEA